MFVPPAVLKIKIAAAHVQAVPKDHSLVVQTILFGIIITPVTATIVKFK